MFGLGMPELIIILVIVILVFGAGKLPEIGGAVGKAIKGFKKSINEPNEKDEAQTKDDKKN
ncbi:MAG: twin-arginine translocase TatA/TatE family subunit [Syntrophus sp. (in: bacteria)]|nr:twin-arginine translocase TatA/TatE family subunit [Syntrophus sp. (in: bacteria)]